MFSIFFFCISFFFMLAFFPFSFHIYYYCYIYKLLPLFICIAKTLFSPYLYVEKTHTLAISFSLYLFCFFSSSLLYTHTQTHLLMYHIIYIKRICPPPKL
ncbi:hypothetical protein BDA99DRAFT_184740 [Phascolomyces articulosus]|uniref:Uncharacterized protein n=1 Tax=Phascolomyces articulosus TaxID=60185 RepID=A0AAD5JS73_9FUNG|nr:hypothetical protein BDA99DRAFT_184740 [Phascolomyces articulosus]